MTGPWRHEAACAGRDTEYWFPDKSDQLSPASNQAMRICATCPVIQMCLDWAVTKPELFGIWGGKTDSERVSMRRTRRLPIDHGTKVGYQRHLMYGESACQPCRTAHAEYQTARRRIRERAKARHQIEPDWLEESS